MARNLSSLALVVLLFCACSMMQTKWETLSEAGMTVQMPGTPQKQTQSVSTAVGHPGKEFTGDSTSPQAATFTARVYWVAPRLYQVLYIRPKTTAAPSENGQKFLDSFQLTGK